MANESLAYRYEINVIFSDKQGTYDIDSNFVRYFLVDRNYIASPIPVIYLSLSVLPEIYDRIVTNETNAKFYFEQNCYNALSNTSIKSNAIKGDFNYMVSSSNPTYTTPLDEGSQSADMNYRTITVALLSMRLMNASRSEKDKSDGILVSGVFGQIDTDTIIGKVVDGFEKYGLKTLIKPPTHNNQFTSLIIPPMNSRKQIIQFLFDRAPFYDTAFTFFIDFDRVYLLDQKAEGTKSSSTGLQNVIFDVRDVVSASSYQEGMTIENGAYIIGVNPAHINISHNKTQNKVANNLVTISEDGTLDVKELSVNNSADSDPKYTFKRGGNAQLYQNILESDVTELVISKESLDGSVFTPNKEYSLQNYEASDEYNGNYLLVQKKDTIINRSGVFIGTTEFRLKKIGHIKNIGDTASDGGNILSTQSETRYTAATPKRSFRPASGSSSSKSSSSSTRTNSSSKKIASENSSGRVDMIAMVGGPTSKVPLKSVVSKMIEENITINDPEEFDWSSRTSKRPDIADIDESNAGPTRVMIAKDGQTLTKKL